MGDAPEEPSTSSVIRDGAVSGVLPETAVFAVHYPGYPSSTARAIETLGGLPEIAKVLVALKDLICPCFLLPMMAQKMLAFPFDRLGVRRPGIWSFVSAPRTLTPTRSSVNSGPRPVFSSDSAELGEENMHPEAEPVKVDTARSLRQQRACQRRSLHGWTMHTILKVGLALVLPITCLSQKKGPLLFLLLWCLCLTVVLDYAPGMVDYQHVLGVHAAEARRKKRPWAPDEASDPGTGTLVFLDVTSWLFLEP